MKEDNKRKKFFTYPKIARKFIMLSIFPALMMTLFCTYFLIKSGETIQREEHEALMRSIYNIRYSCDSLADNNATGVKAEQVRNLKRDLQQLENSLERSYGDMHEKWNDSRITILLVLFFTLGCTIVLVVLSIRKMTESRNKIRDYIKILAEGGDIPPIKIDKKDELKEETELLEKLRKRLGEK